MNLVQLSREQHAGLRIDPAKAAATAANVHLVRIVRSEIRKAAAQYPLFFIKDGETGAFHLAALMGLEPHENLFWDGDTLDAGYVPLNLLRQPFYIGGEDALAGVICVDLDSPALDPAGARAIVEADGSDSPYIAQVQAMLGDLARGQAPTQALVDLAVSLKLVIEISLDITFDNGARCTPTGLYGIDQRALARHLATLPDFETALDLAALLLSLEQVAGLVRRKNRRIADEAAWFEPGTRALERAG
ncbi:SapC family protein [Sphingomonas sp. PAMC 26617]|uniref:SapC family protein n=1 Tax=Sphingomonas sp. PAMC 26617 TaxID=1112216 RepID=UPI00028915D5|nr:SapC family protein [Sphingomonas sp. PAMC 26617]